jgi:hypothetical protein
MSSYVCIAVLSVQHFNILSPASKRKDLGAVEKPAGGSWRPEGKKYLRRDGVSRGENRNLKRRSVAKPHVIRNRKERYLDGKKRYLDRKRRYLNGKTRPERGHSCPHECEARTKLDLYPFAFILSPLGGFILSPLSFIL